MWESRPASTSPLATSPSIGSVSSFATVSTNSPTMDKPEQYASSIDTDIESSVDEEIGLISHAKHSRQLSDRFEGFTENFQWVRDTGAVRGFLLTALFVALWYFFSLSISVYNKWMFSGDKVVFPFPLFMTCMHQVVQFTLATALLYLFPSLRPQRRILPSSPLPGGEAPMPALSLSRFYLTRLIPCGIANALDIGLGNTSLRFTTLTFMTICKSSVLVFILLFAFLFRLESVSTRLILIIAVMTLGEVMMVMGETAFSAIGFSLVTASAFFSGFRWALTQLLLLQHPATSNPFSTIFFLSPINFLSLGAIALVVEGPTAISAGLHDWAVSRGSGPGLFLLLLPGVLAFCMVASQFALLKRSSVVTLSVCGILKEVITICAAGLIFNDKLTVVNVCGVVVIIGSIAAYNYLKISRMQREAQVRVDNEKHS